MVALAVVVGLFFVFPVNNGVEGTEGSEQATKFNGIVTKVSESVSEDKSTKFLQVQVNDQILNITEDSSQFSIPREFEVGDKVIVAQYVDEIGGSTFYIEDFQRIDVLKWLVVAFVLVVLVVTRNQGFGSLIGMVFSFWVIFKVVLPGILAGGDAIWAAIQGVVLIVPVAFFLGHGISRKTLVAAGATLITLIFTGFMAKIFGDIANLSGISSEELNYLKLDTMAVIDFSGLIVAGMIIGVLGILDDITISQASVVQELKSANKKLSFVELFKSAMRVGRDHIASMVNTLVLIYAGASLPMLLLFIDRSKDFMEVINYEFVAQEMIETLVGSMGLILAVPITTLLACWFVGKGGKSADKLAHSHVH